jgi:hypothetical protein
MPPFPFPFVPTAAQLILRPLVTVEFSGQMLMQPGADDTEESRTCEIGINRFSEDHVLQVLLVAHQPNLPPKVINLVRGHLSGDFVIRLGGDENRPGDFGVFAPTPEPFLRTAQAGNSIYDYRWALTIRTLIHPNATRNHGAEPVVKLKTGTLYAPNLTRVGLEPTLERTGSDPIPLFRLTPALAASIPVPVGGSLALEWDHLGDPVSLDLPREGDPDGTIYTVSFVSEPPMGAPIHEEVALYYKVLLDSGSAIPRNQRWRLVYGQGISTDEIPCSPAVLNP